MVFLPVFLFAAYANLILAVRGLVAKGRAALIAQAHFLVCLVGALGVLLGFELIPDPRKGIAGDATNYCVLAFFAFGLLTVALFGGRLIVLARDPATHKGAGVRFGMAIWAVLAGLYLCGVAADHWLFFRDAAHSGTADPGYFGSSVQCRTAVLVRLEGDKAVYRCPTSIELGQNYQRPFAPWPSYTSGEADGRALRRSVEDTKPATTTPADRPVFTVPASEIRVQPK
ncbi:hypothetical protein [Paraburkholderia dioscoreae]|uniref:Uncharacterized protein n=1 Tax=Paraburkholderia dioscoreae TaxID=2604047 RepID=A0A5Q4ZE43_9BURK|nr:hypothetical protein [Paraburkholderia dioscoreae]VVD30913.1 conserved membrane protein of unknown function [Paraburkholderia dioscoreae]